MLTHLSKHNIWCLLSIAATGILPAAASLDFETRRITETFYSEGAGVGDFNKDGKQDIVSGPYWYAGPEFSERHEIYPPEPFKTSAYSKNFLCEAYDIDGNGWDDVLVLGFPGEDAYWFQNPGKEGGHWKRYSAVRPLDNESPFFIDVTGDGKPEVLCSQNGVFGYAMPNWDDPTQLWRFNVISDKITGERFTHGLGIGDVNGDGRMDVLHKGGWLEQPEDLRLAKKWNHHPFNFTAPGGSQMFAYDFDGDGDNDILTSLAAHSYGFAWFAQVKGDDGKLTFNKHLIMGNSPDEKPFGVSFSQAHSVDLVDMDGDGLKDIVTGKRYFAHGGNDPGGKDPAVLYWFKTVRHGKQGKVSFEPHMIHDDSGVGTQVKAIDVSGDGFPDVVVGNKKGTHVHIQKRAAKKPAEAAFKSIFDGKSLTGWDGDKNWWKVADGAITAESTADKPLKKNTFLFWRGGELNDFELKLDFRLTGAPEANSGVQIRSQEHEDGSVSGYQADIDHGTKWLGCLYDEHARGMLAMRGFNVSIHPDGGRVEVAFEDADLLGKHYKKEDWNTYHIKAVGPVITLKINGKLMSETVDNHEGERDFSGKLALQLHSGPASKIEFRNLELKDLGKTELPASEKKK